MHFVYLKKIYFDFFLQEIRKHIHKHGENHSWLKSRFAVLSTLCPDLEAKETEDELCKLSSDFKRLLDLLAEVQYEGHKNSPLTVSHEITSIMASQAQIPCCVFLIKLQAFSKENKFVLHGQQSTESSRQKKKKDIIIVNLLPFQNWKVSQ